MRIQVMRAALNLFALSALILLAACAAQSAASPTPAPTALAIATSAPTSAPTTVPAAPTAVFVPTSIATRTAPPAAPTTVPTAAPTPACAAKLNATPAQTEGPYYKANTPERTSLLEPGMGGTKVTLTGFVLTTDCKPIARAMLDFWQADDKGEYDNTGYRLRGHQFSDASGRYSLETVLPGLYPGRTRHIHVTVRAPNQPALTTQIYFPGEARNQNDGIFNPALVAEMQTGSGGATATFTFVLAAR